MPACWCGSTRLSLRHRPGNAVLISEWERRKWLRSGRSRDQSCWCGLSRGAPGVGGSACEVAMVSSSCTFSVEGPWENIRDKTLLPECETSVHRKVLRTATYSREPSGVT